MKEAIKKIQLNGVLSLALLCFGLNLVTIAGQETKRDRMVANPTPTPVYKPTPPVAAPGAIVQATPTPTPSPLPPQFRTLPELQTKIQSILARGELQRGQVGVKIVSLETGKVVFDTNAEKYFMPASNMKSYTVAAALARLSPNFRFVTSVYAGSMPDASSGAIRGDLTVYGRGDPSLSAAFNDGDYYKGIEALANKIVAAGIKRVEGNLIGDETYFNTEPIPATWEWDDLQWYYGAEISALSVNDNSLDLFVRPGADAGAPALVSLMPNAFGLYLVNRVATAPVGAKREISIYRKLGSNVLEISGTIPANLEKFTSSVAAVRPANVFVSMLRQFLEQKGVTITGQTRVVGLREKNGVALNTTNLIEVTKLESPPFSLIAAKTMKPSQNLYTELILRALGEAVGDKTDPKKTSEQRGLEVVQKFLTEAGIAPGSVVQYDGSGLSRHDLITPASAVQLYQFMNRHQYGQSWRESLTIGAVDGTLKSRFVGTAAANNVRGKTGTIDQVSALTGYVATASGERLAFSVLTNNLPEGRLRMSTIDEIVLALANFNGKTNQVEVK